MRKLLIFIFAASLVFGFVGISGAYTFDMGSNSSVDTSGTAAVLEMWADVNPNFGDYIFTLNEGESKDDLFFATIGTDETWINDDDLVPGTVIAYVDFDNPDITEAVGGTSVGFIGGILRNYSGWDLTWEDPVDVYFGSGGHFAIELSDVGYESWFWMGPDGSADVYATVTLIKDIPEPATLLLLGFGLLSLAGLRRKE